MTAARRQRKASLILAVVLGLGALVAPASAGDPIVVNAQTGLALSGYDPVAYFTESKPKQGRAEMEWSRDGVVWRFANEGNKAAFGDNPDVYTPRFGGYDPVAVARGVSKPGHPLFWAVIGERLYLFYDDAARAAFVADPGRIIETAERRWPEVVRTVSR
jgi:YHS domain-containing protein